MQKYCQLLNRHLDLKFQISLFHIFKKLFEKVMYERLFQFIFKEKILYPHQFWFKKNISISLALLDLCTNLINAIEEKKFSCGIILDFAKAFDTVSHKILLRKLEYYGIRGTPLNFFQSYLNERT